MSRTKVIITKFLSSKFSYVLYDLGFFDDIMADKESSSSSRSTSERERNRQGVKKIHLKNDEKMIQGKIHARLQLPWVFSMTSWANWMNASTKLSSV